MLCFKILHFSFFYLLFSCWPVSCHFILRFVLITIVVKLVLTSVCLPKKKYLSFSEMSPSWPWHFIVALDCRWWRGKFDTSRPRPRAWGFANRDQETCGQQKTGMWWLSYRLFSQKTVFACFKMWSQAILNSIICHWFFNGNTLVPLLNSCKVFCCQITCCRLWTLVC